METKEIRIVRSFNNAINEGNVEILSSFMAEDHTFIDSSGAAHSGIKEMSEGWKDFFRMFPDYLNHFSRIESRDDFVVITGKSTCSNEAKLNTNALWSARIQNDKVSEWQVYEDSPENRRKLQIQ